MSKLPSLRNAFNRTSTDDAVNQVSMDNVGEGKQDPTVVERGATDIETEENQSQLPGEDLQRGVQDVEAVTLTWSKKALIAVFVKYVFSLFEAYRATLVVSCASACLKMELSG